jgi:hypothetical protein
VLDSVVLAQEPSLDVRGLARRYECLVEELTAGAFVAGKTRQVLERVVVAHYAKVFVQHAEECGRAVDDSSDELTLALEFVDAAAELPLEPLLLDGRVFLPGPRPHARHCPTCSRSRRPRADHRAAAGYGGLAMSVELELTRTRTDRRVYALGDIGTLRLEGPFSRAATASADGVSWRFARSGFWRRSLEATDAAGTGVGDFQPRSLRRGGTVRWVGRELTLRPASSWRERYALADGDRELAVIDGKGWGRRPVKVSVDDHEAVEPGLLLFAAFVVRGLAADAQAAAGAGASTAATGS